MNTRTALTVVGTLYCIVATGCGGTKVLESPEAFSPAAPLASGGDARLGATLEWVIFRDGPGTWARRADWDECLLTVHNRSAGPVRVLALTVVDSSGTGITADNDRKRLVKGSRQTVKRYQGHGIEVQAGASSELLYVAGAVGGAVAYGAGSTLALYGGSSAAAAGALGILVLGPALVVGAVIKSGNESEVAREIERRHTVLPLDLAAGETGAIVQFFPLAPAPQYVELVWADADGEYALRLDTSEVLAGLHLAP
jgi:hypothetical protein